MMFRKLIYLLPVFLASITGCSISRSFVSFETLEPAEITYPKDVEKIGYLNRSQVDISNFLFQENTFPFDYLLLCNDIKDIIVQDSIFEERIPVFLMDSSKSSVEKLIMLDNVVNNNLIDGFIEALNTGYYNQFYTDSMLYIDARFTNDLLFKSEPLSDKIKLDILNKYNLDALITQDEYIIGIRNYPPLYSSKGEIAISSSVKYSLYFRDSKLPTDEYTYKDRSYYQYDLKDTGTLTVDEMLADYMANIGYAYGMKHVPVWIPQTRMIFGGINGQLRSAKKYTRNNNWDEAVKIWNDLLSRSNHKITAKAHHNLAVYYEMTDDLDNALDNLEQANDIWNNKDTAYYLEEMKTRKKNYGTIVTQVR